MRAFETSRLLILLDEYPFLQNTQQASDSITNAATINRSVSGLINSLKRHKDDTREVKEGLECGIGVDGMKKFLEGDIIEVYEIREVKRKLEAN